MSDYDNPINREDVTQPVHAATDTHPKEVIKVGDKIVITHHRLQAANVSVGDILEVTSQYPGNITCGKWLFSSDRLNNGFDVYTGQDVKSAINPPHYNDVKSAINPPHYNDGKIEVIEYIEDKGLGFCLGNAVKYISRAGKKDPSKRVEDLTKAIWYLEREINNES